MRIIRKVLAGLCVTITFFLSFASGHIVLAEETDSEKTYTVTFRAGNVGTFNTEAVETSDTIEVTENYVRFAVKSGQTLPFENDEAVYAFIQTLTSSVVDETGTTIDFIKPNYRLRPISDWADGAASKEICRNYEYVLDYVRLVNPVMYKIVFIDTESKEQIAPPIIAHGEAGETIACKFGSIANYAPVTEDGSMVLNDAALDGNTYVFECAYTGECEVTYIPGDTIVNTVVNESAEQATPGVNIVTPGRTTIPKTKTTPSGTITSETAATTDSATFPETAATMDSTITTESVSTPDGTTISKATITPGNEKEQTKEEGALADASSGSVNFSLLMGGLAVLGMAAIAYFVCKKWKKRTM